MVGTWFLCYSLYKLHFWNEFKFKKKKKYYVKDCIPWEGEWHGQISVWKALFGPYAEEFLPEWRLGQGKPDYWRLLELVACFFKCPGSFTCLYTASRGFYFYDIKITVALQRVIFGNSFSVFEFFSPKDRKYVLKM